MSKETDHLFRRLAESDLGRRAIQVVAFGDSVTQGAMEMGRLGSSETYHRLFHQDLEAFYPTTTINVINSGISGETASQAIARLERDVLRYEPDLAFIAFGLNDSVDGPEKIPVFSEAIRHIVREIRGRAPATIVLITPPFMATSKSSRIHPLHEECAELIIRTQTDGVLADYAAALRAVAAEEETVLADVHAEWQRLRETGLDLDCWLSNGLNHPDVRGHRLAAKVIWNSLFAR